VTWTQRVLSILESDKKATFNTLYKLCPGIKRKYLSNLLYRLQNRQIIKKEGDFFLLVAPYDSHFPGVQLPIIRHRVTDYSFTGEVIKFGVVSDSHLGSVYDNVPLLKAAYDVFDREGITKVFHAGDICDGEHMRQGHEYELRVVGFDKQCEYVVNEYPHREGIETIFLCGNHDMSFWKYSGVDIGVHIARQRPDLKYIGTLEADITLTTTTGSTTVRLWHPLLGSAYAISYHPQRYIESLSGGSKPGILIIGNFHKAEWLFYRNIHTLQPGCLQFQTRWMKGKRISAHLGFSIVEAHLCDKGVARLKFEFFPDYDS